LPRSPHSPPPTRTIWFNSAGRERPGAKLTPGRTIRGERRAQARRSSRPPSRGLATFPSRRRRGCRRISGRVERQATEPLPGRPRGTLAQPGSAGRYSPVGRPRRVDRPPDRLAARPPQPASLVAPHLQPRAGLPRQGLAPALALGPGGMVDLDVDLRHPPIVYLAEMTAPNGDAPPRWYSQRVAVPHVVGRMLRSHIAHHLLPLEPGGTAAAAGVRSEAWCCFPSWTPLRPASRLAVPIRADRARPPPTSNRGSADVARGRRRRSRHLRHRRAVGPCRRGDLVGLPGRFAARGQRPPRRLLRPGQRTGGRRASSRMTTPRAFRLAIRRVPGTRCGTDGRLQPPDPHGDCTSVVR
jgi:hypothetical protein